MKHYVYAYIRREGKNLSEEHRQKISDGLNNYHERVSS